MNLKKKKIIVNNPWIEEERVKFLLIYIGNQFTSFVVAMVYTIRSRDFPCGSDGKESACSVGEQGSISGLGRSSIQGNGNLLQYCLENSVDTGAWRATVHGVTESDMTEWLTHTHIVYTVTWNTQLMNTELGLSEQIQV